MNYYDYSRSQDRDMIRMDAETSAIRSHQPDSDRPRRRRIFGRRPVSR